MPGRDDDFDLSERSSDLSKRLKAASDNFERNTLGTPLKKAQTLEREINELLPSVQNKINNFLGNNELKKYVNDLKKTIEANLSINYSSKDLLKYQEVFKATTDNSKNDINSIIKLDKSNNCDLIVSIFVNVKGIDIARLNSIHSYGYQDYGERGATATAEAQVVGMSPRLESLLDSSKYELDLLPELNYFNSKLPKEEYESFLNVLKKMDSMSQPELNEMLLDSLTDYTDRAGTIYQKTKK